MGDSYHDFMNNGIDDIISMIHFTEGFTEVDGSNTLHFDNLIDTTYEIIEDSEEEFITIE